MKKIFGHSTDQDWEKYGAHDPYYGVVTNDIYKKENLTKENKDKFFKSGEDYIEHVFSNIKQLFGDDFSPVRTLDFGCGVGRLSIPLARRSKYVVGLDISPSMLKEAKTNCDVYDIHNIKFMKSNNAFQRWNEKFDLIHSFIVFQHIPIKYGEKIFKTLLGYLNDEGVGVFHFTYSTVLYGFKKNFVRWVKEKFPFMHNISNIIKARSFSAPRMQMNSYNLNLILYFIQKNNVLSFYTEFTNDNGALGVIIYFKKNGK